MATQTQPHVVVWEWLYSGSRWKTYSPTVAQVLEKAYRNKLTQVLLGDADPTLGKFRVSLTSMVQICEQREEATPVRRTLYPRSSPAGQGIRWDWLGDRFSEWFDYEMEIQNTIEHAWSTGLQTLDISKTCASMPYIINFCNMTQVRKDTGFVRSIRRIQQATYPAALRTEVPTESVIHHAAFKPGPVEKTPSLKGNWLSGIINVVKHPNKSGGEPKISKPAVQSSSVSAMVDDSKSTTRENAHRNRRESRLALRVERRAPRRSSSLDTVSTCLSQDSAKKPYRHAKAANAV